MLDYKKTRFDPAQKPATGSFKRVAKDRDDWAYDAGRAVGSGKERHHVFGAEAVLALNVALATHRPLLVRGEPGSGKTTLARFAALALGRRFYRLTVSSRTQAGDLQSSFDALRRLNHAQEKHPDGLPAEQAYVLPGILWWAMAPASAAMRGTQPLAEKDAERVPALVDPGEGPEGETALLLLDEIDKADPDVPNDLLEVLDERSFTVPETGHRIEATRSELLIVMTTNDERELPPAFLRRCVTLTLPPPDRAWLVDIARRRFGADINTPAGPLHGVLADALLDRRAQAKLKGRRKPSTSEYLDAVRACRELLAGSTSPAALARVLDMVTAKDAIPAEADEDDADGSADGGTQA
jgi:MoxR-like ATPase